jgi:hypothetical protein
MWIHFGFPLRTGIPPGIRQFRSIASKKPLHFYDTCTFSVHSGQTTKSLNCLKLNCIGAWEPMFHAVEANNFVYVPGGGGTIWKLNKTDGTSVSPINPFNGMAIDVKNTFVAGPLTADANGNIYYSVVELADPSLGDPWRDNDVVASWLVKVTPQDKANIMSFATLVPNAPLGTATTCPAPFFVAFGPGSYPFPPTIDAVAPTVLCGPQRPVVTLQDLA